MLINIIAIFPLMVSLGDLGKNTVAMNASVPGADWDLPPSLAQNIKCAFTAPIAGSRNIYSPFI
jgi:hypothetical protein